MVVFFCKKDWSTSQIRCPHDEKKLRRKLDEISKEKQEVKAYAQMDFHMKVEPKNTTISDRNLFKDKKTLIVVL